MGDIVSVECRQSGDGDTRIGQQVADLRRGAHGQPIMMVERIDRRGL